ncbi:MAG: hypothetical protein KDA24_16185 [Deltaproteobacteria bacterium]|nr:hypothetical protein [Deltaproteobacteria bacterium]
MSPPNSLPETVLRKLASVRRRRRALALLEAACWALLGLAVLLGVLALLPEGSAAPWIRGLARVWVAACVIVPTAMFVVPPWRRTRSWSGLARAVDDRVPETGDRLLTAVDLAGALDRDSIAEPETIRLAQQHLGAAEKIIDSVQPEQILPVTGLHPSTLLGPVAAMAIAALWSFSSGPFERGLDAVFGPVPVDESAVADAAPEDVVTLTLRNLAIRLVPPSYSGRAEVVLDGTTGDIVALPGTRVFLEAESNSAGKAAQARLESSETPVEGQLDGKRLSLEFVTDNSTWYRVLVPRGLGRAPLQSRRFVIDLLPDRPPELEVLAPAGPLTLAPADSVPMQVRASDDFALSRLEQVVLIDGNEVLRVPVAPVQGLAAYDDLLRWSPESLEGKGGDLEFVVEAWDNDLVNGPKVTRSRPVEIYVPTAKDQHRKVLALKRELADAALDMLAGLLVSNLDGQRRNQKKAVLAEHDQQAALADSFFRVASELFEAMARDDLEEGNAFAGILQLVRNLDTQWSGVVEYVENEVRAVDRPFVHPVVVRNLISGREPVISELEQIVLDLSSFIDLHQGESVRGELADLGNELADMQELLRRADDGEPMDEELAAAMQKVRERMAELAKKLADRSSGPDDGFQNSMPGALSKDLLAEVEELIKQGRFEEAMEKLREADDAVADMEEQLANEAPQMAGAQNRDALDQALSEAIEQAKELEQQQGQVLQQAKELAERFSDPQADEAIEEIRKDIAELSEQVEALREGGNGPFAPSGAERQAVRSASFEVQGVEQALNEGMPDEAAAYAREAESRLKGAARAAQDTDRAKRERAAGKLAGSIAKKLDDLDAQQRQRQAQAKQAGQQAGQQQGGVANGVAQLQQKMNEMGGSAFNPAGARGNLQNAEQLMRRAQGQLGQGDPGRAQSSGEDGQNQLRQFRESLEGTQQALREGGSGQSGPKMAQRPGQGQTRWDSQGDPEDTGKVELTDPDEFVGPEAFRALLQEGAQGDAPDRYKPLNGTYYEELVR